MAKLIIWSPLSESDIINIIDYLQSNWDEQVLSNFIDQVDLIMTQIAAHPRLFPIVNKKLKIRKCVISKHNCIFYIERKHSVDILRCFDTRQNPKKLKI